MNDSLDAALFDVLTHARDVTEPGRITPDLYGPLPAIEDDLEFEASYAKLLDNADAAFVDADSQRPPRSVEQIDRTPRKTFRLRYTVFQPADSASDAGLPLLILLPGVPVNRYEWFPAARILGRFMRVVTLDYLGMGQSSQPLGFGKNWRWATQAKAVHMFVHHLLDEKHPEWFRSGFVVGGSDWGGGVAQKYGELYWDHMLPHLMALWLINPIALNGYWTPQIGALTAFTRPPLDSPELPVQAEALVGQMTTLLEGMFHRTAEMHNKHSLAWLQSAYFNVRAYNDVTKNPGNTEVYWGALRCLAEQAAEALGNGELLPHHPEKNPDGLRFTRWDFPVLVSWGANDKMMPDNQGWRFAQVIAHAIRLDRAIGGRENALSVQYERLCDAAHFSNYDQPEATADAFLRFLYQAEPRAAAALHTAYIGLDTITRQDERWMIDRLTEANQRATDFLPPFHETD